MVDKDPDALYEPSLTAVSTSVTKPSSTRVVVKRRLVEDRMSTSVSPGTVEACSTPLCPLDVVEGKGVGKTCTSFAAHLQESTWSLEPKQVKAQDQSCKHLEVKCQAHLKSGLHQENRTDMHVSGAYEGIVLQDWTANANESDYTAKKAERHRNFSHEDGGGSVFDEQQAIPGERLPVLSISVDLEETEVEGVCHVALPIKKRRLKVDADDGSVAPRISPDRQGESVVPKEHLPVLSFRKDLEDRVVEGACHVVLPFKKRRLNVDADDGSVVSRVSPDRQGESVVPKEHLPVLSFCKDLQETEVEGACHVALPFKKRRLEVDADDGSAVPRVPPDRPGAFHIPASSYHLEGENVPMDIHVMRESYQRKEEVFHSHGGEGWSSTSDHPALSQVHRSARAMRPAMLGAGTHTEGGSFSHHTMTRVQSASHETTADVNDSIQNESCGPFTPHMDITPSLCVNSSQLMFSTDNDVVKHNQRRESITPAKARGELMSHPSDVVQLQVQHDAGQRATGTFSCPYCPKSLSGERGLQKHIKRQHEDGKEHNCPHCGGMFVAPSHLRTHTDSVHGKLRPHECSQCEKKFSTKSKLNRHTRLVHDQVKKYPCLICGKMFGRRENLEEHFEALHDNVGHECPKCAKTFSLKRYMKRHMARVHDAKQ